MDRWPPGTLLAEVLILRERTPGECRVAATPETVRRLLARGLTLQVEQSAGLSAGYADDEYEAAGARLVASSPELGAGVDAVLCVNPPAAEVLDQLRAGTLLAGLLSPYGATALVEQLQARRVSALALELLPRISRAQTMDVLSSQANIAGYKAVLLASAALDRYVPMLMTAAGTIQPARALSWAQGWRGCRH
jgi:NAD/NADP transhydrogenase alpha subunit